MKRTAYGDSKAKRSEKSSGQHRVLVFDGEAMKDSVDNRTSRGTSRGRRYKGDVWVVRAHQICWRV